MDFSNTFSSNESFSSSLNSNEKLFDEMDMVDQWHICFEPILIATNFLEFFSIIVREMEESAKTFVDLEIGV